VYLGYIIIQTYYLGKIEMGKDMEKYTLLSACDNCCYKGNDFSEITCEETCCKVYSALKRDGIY
jgi:hypothetical protein